MGENNNKKRIPKIDGGSIKGNQKNPPEGEKGPPPPSSQPKSENKKGDKDELLDTLNKMWELIPYENKPTYAEFNTVTPLNENVGKLRTLEQNDPDIGIARFDSPLEGISTLSIIATITEKGFGDRLAVDLEDDETKYNGHKKIMGFSWHYDQNPEDKQISSADVPKKDS